MKHEHLQLLLTREIPFGKYKGRVIADLPGNYLNWFAREGFPPGEIGQLLALMHELVTTAYPTCLIRCAVAERSVAIPPVARFESAPVTR